MTTFDFKDGKGPVPASQHPNGRGWVADTANVDPSAYVGPDARVSGSARVRGHVLVLGRTIVSGNTLVSGDVRVSGNARVEGNAWVNGNAQVSGYARVSGDAQVRGQVSVFGHARVSGVAFIGGDAQVSGGDWEISPLYVQGTRHSITTSSFSTLTIGCQEHPVEYWLENYEAIGVAEGYTERQIEEYGFLIKVASIWLENNTPKNTNKG